MKCPKCGHATGVIDTRNHEWRRRECKSEACGHRFYTQEVIVDGFVARGKKREQANTPEVRAARDAKEVAKVQRAVVKAERERPYVASEWEKELARQWKPADNPFPEPSTAPELHPAFARRMPPGTAVRLGK